MNKNDLTRRDFVKTGSAAMAGGLITTKSAIKEIMSREKMRLAIVGVGIRGTSMWGRSVVQEYSDVTEFVGFCDNNPGRLELAKKTIGVDVPVYADFEKMVNETKPTHVIVTTVDSTHHEFIIKAMEMGCDVITEKPLTTDAEKAQAIIDAEERTGKHVTVTFNYRFSPHRQKMKEILQSGQIGELTSVDFHWYLDVYHGASYFRRWHGKIDKGGSLYVHKASHHFDLLNWWIESDPELVFGMGALEHYGSNGDFRHTNCRGCPHADKCDFYWDITKDARSMALYVDNEQHDGYLRDGCVYDDKITSYDKMSAQIRYMNGVVANWSCTTYSPYEGYRIAFNGTKGRLEAWIKERQPWNEEALDEIRVTDNFGYTSLIEIPHGGGGHGGGDTRLKDRVFRDPTAPDPFRQAAGLRDGVMSVLIGIAARQSTETNEPVRIADLTSYEPMVERM